MMLYTYILYGILLTSPVLSLELKEAFSWYSLDFNWPSADFKNDALKSGAYVVENNALHGFSVWRNKLFLTIARYRPGVASSLNYIEIGSEKSPQLNPYPSWDANFIQDENENSLKDDSSVVSAFRSWVDGCDRLWVMDTGLTNISGMRKPFAKPSIVIYDLTTDTLVRRHNLKDSDVKKSSYLLNIVVDVDPEKCNEAYAYVADMASFAMIVYSFKDDYSWRLKHHYFYFSPLESQYNIGGVEFQWSDGLFGIALSKRNSNNLKNVYFHPLSSTKEFVVSNEVLQNETWATSHKNFHNFKLVGDRGESSHASISNFHEETGIIFYTQVKRDGIACWNSGKPLNNDTFHLFVSNETTLEFPNDLKIVDNTLWILSNKLPKFIYQSLDSEEINFKIFNVPIEDAIKGTPCE